MEEVSLKLSTIVRKLHDAAIMGKHIDDGLLDGGMLFHNTPMCHEDVVALFDSVVQKLEAERASYDLDMLRLGWQYLSSKKVESYSMLAEFPDKQYRVVVYDN